ncbi:TPA: hypothetical protein L6A25_30505 [Pseudomonas aeruginosa]|uniref:hypothetical protein n=1 Tax=Pseudomonas qingdaonensis TaxID=2056231 RepID=UPI00265FAAFC|nr:hypothetical protein [Pseudomonas qingdaonensis]HBP5920937.1 hypothetical protein [Pseudomonas aeruginosa]WKL67264.1 hypothetical protein Q1Z72_00885 [Pseudomonas qingdaonensis]HBP5954177.1 hypothetical protein [Pseudomonas aeruginosa]HBP6061865.1 hypothetical protein [Pseudomonas aeruginosa]HBP6170895.1 hypothetical protein [Pseudomonas aeruginosa]
MSYMAVLKYGQRLQRQIAVFGQTPQICGARLFDQLLSWHGDEHWQVCEETCRLFRVVQAAPGIEHRREIHGTEKKQALQLVRSVIAG